MTRWYPLRHTPFLSLRAGIGHVVFFGRCWPPNPYMIEQTTNYIHFVCGAQFMYHC